MEVTQTTSTTAMVPTQTNAVTQIPWWKVVVHTTGEDHKETPQETTCWVRCVSGARALTTGENHVMGLAYLGADYMAGAWCYWHGYEDPHKELELM